MLDLPTLHRGAAPTGERSARRWARLGLSAVSTVAALLLLEGGLRLAWPGRADAMNLAAFTRTSTRPGQMTELIPGARNDHFVGGPVRINEHGRRGPSAPLEKPRDTVRILAVGDSVTFGYGVREEATYHQLIASRWTAGGGRRFEAINAGLTSAGLPYVLHTVRAECSVLDPDLILVGLVVNDFGVYPPEVLEERPLARSRTEADPGRWRLLGPLHRSTVVTMSLHLAKSLLYRTRLLDLSDSPGYHFPALADPSPALDEVWESSLSVMDATVEAARECGSPIAFTLFPLEIQLSASALRRYTEDLGFPLGEGVIARDPQRRLAEWAADRGVSFIDLAPAFLGPDPSALYLRGGYVTVDPVHPSEEGHRVAADQLVAHLEEMDLFPEPGGAR